MTNYHLRQHPHIEIRLSPNKRSRRITLRASARDGRLNLTHPLRMSQREIEAFIEQHEGWILRHYRPVKLVEIGGTLPFRGMDYSLVAGDKRGVHIVDDTLTIKSPNTGRAVTGFLKTQAALYAADRVNDYAQELGKPVTALRWRDPKSRWGSCDSKGVIMLSWRLIMAPDWIFDYVIAHEVGHLMHMDHSPRFWRQVEAIYPQYDTARKWMRRHGKDLQTIQFTA